MTDELRLSHYRLIQRLGAGGMGEVYCAEDLKLERTVAIKLLATGALTDPERVQRFVAEAKAASSLNHPGIMTIHQVGEFEGRHFIVMEFVDGETVRQRLERGPIELRTTLEVAVQVAEALAAAHAAGIVHRDIKPENLMIRPDGFVKVLDFGLAKLVEPGGGAAALFGAGAADGETLVQSSSPRPSISGSSPTVPGTVLGTVGYMAPEQVRGERVDHRTDLFALGCVLYEMATGARAFGTGSPIEVMHAILKDQPAPLLERRPDAPAELQRIVRKAMVKVPDERYQSAKEMAIDLRQLQREIDSGAGSAAWPAVRPPAEAEPARRRPPAWVRGAVLGAVAAGVAAALFALRRQAPEVAPAASMKISRLTTSGQVASPALSPDRKYVAYVATQGGKPSIQLRQLATGSEVTLVPAGDDGLESLEFSPDGNWLLFRRHPPGSIMGVLHQVPTLGGTPRPLLDDVDSRVSFAPDGRRFVFFRHVPTFDSEIRIASLDGGATQQVLAGAGPLYLTQPRWSPDGQRVAVAMRDKSKLLTTYVGLLGVPDGRVERLGSGWSNFTGLAWAPDGSGLYVAAGRGIEDPPQIWFVRARDGAATQVTTDLDIYSEVGLSGDGSGLVAMRTTTVSNLWRVPVDGEPAANAAAAVRLTSGTGRVQSPSASPDGRWILYQSDAAGSIDVWRMDADGRNARQLTFDPATEVGPAWSHDAARIAYAVVRGDSAQVWVMNADGTAAHQVTHGGLNSVPSWSPDSQWIAYHSTRDGLPTVWKVPADGSGPAVRLTETWSFMPQWSPDGTRIGFWAVPIEGTPRPTLGLVPPEGGAIEFLSVRFTTRNFFWRWKPDASGFTTASYRDGIWSLHAYPRRGGEPATLVQFPADDVLFSFTWMADGRAVLCERGTVSSDVVLLEGFRR